MSSEVTVALLACLGTVLGSFGGVLSSAKLTNFRIKQLESKVDKHNNFASRIPLLEKDIKVLNHRVSDLETSHQNYI